MSHQRELAVKRQGHVTRGNIRIWSSLGSLLTSIQALPHWTDSLTLRDCSQRVTTLGPDCLLWLQGWGKPQSMYVSFYKTLRQARQKDVSRTQEKPRSHEKPYKSPNPILQKEPTQSRRSAPHRTPSTEHSRKAKLWRQLKTWGC